MLYLQLILLLMVCSSQNAEGIHGLWGSEFLENEVFISRYVLGVSRYYFYILFILTDVNSGFQLLVPKFFVVLSRQNRCKIGIFSGFQTIQFICASVNIQNLTLQIAINVNNAYWNKIIIVAQLLTERDRPQLWLFDRCCDLSKSLPAIVRMVQNLKCGSYLLFQDLGKGLLSLYQKELLNLQLSSLP
jgi:hypothetical protein